MKAKLIWFVVITAALVAAGFFVLWMQRCRREADKARARLRGWRLGQSAIETKQVAWEIRRPIGLSPDATVVAV
jgi:hypothetical protein